MKRSTLELLCCPDCRAALLMRDESGGEILNEGCLICPQCERSYPIENGIARFIDRQELKGLNRRFSRFYDWFSHFYALFTKMALLPFGGDRRARREILDRLDPHGGRILEVSIGSGENLPYLFESPMAVEVHGLDISAGQLARCGGIVIRWGWPVELFLGTAEALPFKADAFDSILHIGGINFFSDRKRAMDEMIRVARPGCKIVIADESEELARLIGRIPGLSRPHKEKKKDTTPIADLVPEAMENKRMDGIWKAHGKHHGYCLEFRKPG